ncbi:MAG: cyclase family protein [Acidobacteria bacterium]|nr:cyclase family protein [Acidobacteriota bacterium]MBK8813078.1 cyclase family protein [Acidobacteriota bacterium]
MKITFAGNEFDASDPISIAIPMEFAGGQPNAFGVDRATSQACESGPLVGDTRRGGSCNFEKVTMIPHCNGTHTECVGHVTSERIAVIDCLRDVFSIAALISIAAEPAGDTGEKYVVPIAADDLLITERALRAALAAISSQLSTISNVGSMIIRTLPNPASKKTTTYLETVPPYFTTEAMEFIAASGFRHLLVDLPSIDRIYDDGKLANHRIFWNIEPGSFDANEKTRVGNTVTELIFVPDDIADGVYLLNLQIAPFAADAAPSRPVLFRNL